MAYVADQPRTIWKLVEFLPALLEPFLKRRETRRRRFEEDRERRDFILDKMQSHSDAFQSELDVQNMMFFYPSRY